MKRFVCGMLSAALTLAAVSPAAALTQEEILKRRLEKMQKADPAMRTEDQQRQEHFRQSTTTAAPAPSKAAETLAIPDPIRPPTSQPTSDVAPEPRGGLWQQPPGKAAARPSPSTSAPQQTATPTPASPPPPPAQVMGQPPRQAAAPAPAPAPTAVARDPKAATSLAAMAAKATASGDNQTALTMLGEAVAADPADPDLYNNRGNVLSNMGKTREALADYDRAISMKTSDPAYFSNRGLAHERLGNQDRACADYKNACDLGDCEFYKSFKAEGHCR